MEGSKSYFFVIKKMKYNKKLFKILLNSLLYQDSNYNFWHFEIVFVLYLFIFFENSSLLSVKCVISRYGIA